MTREHSGTVPSPAPSCQRDTARDGAPGPLAWTSHDPETVRSPSSRGPSQHAAHVEPPGRDHPRAGLSGLWPGGPAVTPWRGGQKPPPHRLYKHCQLDLTNTYRPVRGDTGHPAGWLRLLDTVATDRSTKGMPAYPKAAPPSRVVRGEELQDLFRAVKGAFHDLVSSSCTSGKNGTRGGR